MAVIILLLAGVAYLNSGVSAMTCAPYESFPHPSVCTKYYFCDKESRPHLFICPDRLHFNTLKSVCDWPENANCTLESVEVELEGDIMGLGYIKGNSSEGSHELSLLERVNSMLIDLVLGSDSNSTDLEKETVNITARGSSYPINHEEVNDIRLPSYVSLREYITKDKSEDALGYNLGEEEEAKDIDAVESAGGALLDVTGAQKSTEKTTTFGYSEK